MAAVYWSSTSRVVMAVLSSSCVCFELGDVVGRFLGRRCLCLRGSCGGRQVHWLPGTLHTVLVGTSRLPWPRPLVLGVLRNVADAVGEVAGKLVSSRRVAASVAAVSVENASRPPGDVSTCPASSPWRGMFCSRGDGNGRKDASMPRLMSVALTTDAVPNREKAVTRRVGWRCCDQATN
jgi:hypothetical protein